MYFHYQFTLDLCRSTNTSQRNHWKCVWVLRGSRNLSESERDCEHNGGAVFTFDTVQEANYTLRVLGVGKFTYVNQFPNTPFLDRPKVKEAADDN